MSDYESLMADLLSKNPGLSREDIEQKVGERMSGTGAGYLSKEGALHLVAGELDTPLPQGAETRVASLKDLQAGAKDVSLETRVIGMSDPRPYSGKDGKESSLRSMYVYDKDGTASVTLWGEKATMEGLEDVRPGDLVRIIKAYVRADRDGKPVLNIGSGSSLQPADGESDIPPIDSITQDVSAVRDGQQGLVVAGELDGMVSTIRFTNAKGQPRTALKMSLRGSGEGRVPVILWGRSEEDVPKMIPVGAKVRLYGVNSKQGMQGLELQGNEATGISVDGETEAGPVTVRIISSSKGESGDGFVLAADRDGRLITMIDTAGKTAGFAEGDTIECMPTRAYGTSVRLEDDSLARKVDEDPAIPTLESLRTKVADIQPGASVCIEAIILKKTERRDIQTKAGDSVALSEMLVEDDSGQIWVKGWRNQARLVDKCSGGEIVSITGLNARAGMEGRTELNLGAFSKVSPRS